MADRVASTPTPRHRPAARCGRPEGGVRASSRQFGPHAQRAAFVASGREAIRRPADPAVRAWQSKQALG